MRWPLFLQVVIILIIFVCSSYLLYPKYEFYYRVNSDGELCIYRANKISGIAEVFMRDKPFNAELSAK